MARPWIYYEHVALGQNNNSVKIVQGALNKEFGGVATDGQFGPQTKAAYQKWQKKLGYTGSDADGNPGVTSLTALGKKDGFDCKHTPSPAPAKASHATVGNYETQPEPAMDMSRTTYGGHTVNRRTAVLLERAAAIYGVAGFALSQGSYNKGVAASAGTHDGGGVVDLNISGLNIANAVAAMRKAGFAAWHRTPAQGFAHHIHACAIGDREMEWLAADQVQGYFNGRNGLAGNGADTDPPLHWPNWADKYNH